MADVESSSDDRLTKRSDSEVLCDDWEIVESSHISDSDGQSSDATHEPGALLPAAMEDGSVPESPSATEASVAAAVSRSLTPTPASELPCSNDGDNGSGSSSRSSGQTSTCSAPLTPAPCQMPDSGWLRPTASDKSRQVQHLHSTVLAHGVDLIIIAQPSTFRPVARRPHRHFVFHLPVLNLLLPGMLCIIAVHHMLCKSRHPQQQPLSLGSFSSFASRNPCPEGLCLSS